MNIERQSFASSRGFSVVQEFMGHGTGTLLHMLPYVSHVANTEALSLRPGMLFTVEPILVEGSPEIGLWNDGWTAATRDGRRCILVCLFVCLFVCLYHTLILILLSDLSYSEMFVSIEQLNLSTKF